MTSSDWLPTACILCECNCGIVVQVDDRRLARIRGDKAHPGSAGYTCNKALRLDHYQNNRARLSSPMRRRADGTYEEIDWDTAIVEIAEGFKQIRDTHGGDKIFYYGGGGQGNHLGGAYSGAFLKALGSRYRSNALAQEKTGEAWVDFQLYGGHTRGEGRQAYTEAFLAAAATNPTVAKLTAYVLYETLGPTLPDGLAGAAALWGLAQKTAMAYPDAVRRAGHADGNALFDAILERPSGVTFTVHNYEDDFALISHPDHKIALEIPEMLAEIRSLTQTPSRLTTPQLPIVLSVGERRAYTANDIFRDPSWRKRDANGALRVSVEDAQALGLADGCLARITTAAGSAEATVEVTETMLAGHAALPNGFGLDYTGDDGRTVVAGVAPNALTSTRWRDPYAGTPWHKHVPAAIRRADAESPIW